MCEDNFIPRADDINPTDSVIIAWLLKKEVSDPDDDIIYEKAVDDVEVVYDSSVNGIDVAWYRAVETYDGKDYATLTYALEDGDSYVEIAFWLDGENAEAEAQAIIRTLGFVSR